ncbi:MAG: hypothetical protein NC038_05550 [Paludibacter sp.]|nr:hypothetical protein [Bacteroidales bacterium]MCM1069836.1 hypothetical protein [Prevotella sp.]MCM1353970.1 hypothetical protein [Bacteroides sp.]MCM1443388.1 hypothetical protein [Muribaculum sp.]MCM1482091.1 hypothetical protein [Paludibacter sp.]
MAISQKDAVRQWKELCATIQNMSTINKMETEAVRQARIEHARRDYAFFVSYYFPHYCTHRETGDIIPSATFHIDAAKKILRTRNLRAVFKWARGHAKSTHMDIMIPMWLKCQKQREINVMVLVGKSEDNANILLGDIQAELQYNKRYIHDFGKQYNAGDWQEGKFVTADGCAFFALGRGQSPRGLRHRNNRPDYIVIDDLDDDELCKNESRVSKLTDWVKEALFGCFGAMGGRFIMVGNLIGKNSVLAKIAATNGVFVSKVNVLDNKGNPTWAAFWSKERIAEMQQFMGYRAFQKEYMNNPINEGAVFRAQWIRWKRILPLREYAELVLYIDPSFKPTTKNDYKAAKLWGKTKSGELHHIAAFVRQCTVVEMVRWLYDLYERLHKQDVAVTFYMEANFMQDIILDEFTREGELRGYQLPIIPDKRKKPDKFQRIEAISPLWERGLVFYNEAKRNDPDMLAGLEQTLAFEKGMSGHDDAPDADEGAIYKLQQRTRQNTFEPIVGRYHNSKHTW